MSISLEERCKHLISELELGSVEDVVSITPLTGGVSSDIALVDMGSRKICVKFALEQLKVVEAWHAKVERNQAEYRWLEFVASIEPKSTPVLMGCSDSANGFAMEFVEGDGVYLWKTALLQGQPDSGEAEKVAYVLGQVHCASSFEVSSLGFQNQQDFYALRLEPYLIFTATRHPDLARKMHALVDMLNSHNLALIHGDVSPKNIIFRQEKPVFLDAECATIGDPSFDVSFCLNHLILKAMHIKGSRHSLLASVQDFWTAYQAHVLWESSDELEKRVCALIPALMLARIDGKSPVEYLDDHERKIVRSLAIPLIKDPVKSIAGLVEYINLNMENE